MTIERHMRMELYPGHSLLPWHFALVTESGRNVNLLVGSGSHPRSRARENNGLRVSIPSYTSSELDSKHNTKWAVEMAGVDMYELAIINESLVSIKSVNASLKYTTRLKVGRVWIEISWPMTSHCMLSSN